MANLGAWTKPLLLGLTIGLAGVIGCNGGDTDETDTDGEDSSTLPEQCGDGEDDDGDGLIDCDDPDCDDAEECTPWEPDLFTLRSGYAFNSDGGTLDTDTDTFGNPASELGTVESVVIDGTPQAPFIAIGFYKTNATSYDTENYCEVLMSYSSTDDLYLVPVDNDGETNYGITFADGDYTSEVVCTDGHEWEGSTAVVDSFLAESWLIGFGPLSSDADSWLSSAVSDSADRAFYVGGGFGSGDGSVFNDVGVTLVGELDAENNLVLDGTSLSRVDGTEVSTGITNGEPVTGYYITQLTGLYGMN